MEIQRIIRIGNGNGTKVDFYFWEEYTTYEEARSVADDMKRQFKAEGVGRTKSFILALTPSVYALYFSRRLRIV